MENLSGLSPDPEKGIFVVRENGTTCLMAEFAAKLIVPYDVSASNYVDVRIFRSRLPDTCPAFPSLLPWRNVALSQNGGGGLREGHVF